MGELTDKAKGKVRQIKGELTGNEAERLKGKAEEGKGKLKGAFEEAKHEVKKAFRQPEEDEIPDQP